MAGLTARKLEDRASTGILMMLVAYFMFSFIDTSAKWLVLAGLGAAQLSFMRYVGHFAISLAQIAKGGLTIDRLKTSHLGMVLLRAALLVSATIFNFISVKYLPLTITSAVMFSAPIIVCALSWPLLGERVGPWRWFAIVLGFLGVLIVVRPFNENFHWAVMLSIYNAIAMALYSILTRKLSGLVATETMQLYAGGLGTVLFLPAAIFTWQNPATPWDWIFMFGLGLWGWAGHELLTRAHSFAPANTLMPYTYSFLIYLTIASYVVFDQIPDSYTLTGAFIVVLSGLIIWAREKQKGK